MVFDSSYSTILVYHYVIDFIFQLDQGVIPFSLLSYSERSSTSSSSPIVRGDFEDFLLFVIQHNGASDVVFSIGDDSTMGGISGSPYIIQRPALFIIRHLIHK